MSSFVPYIPLVSAFIGVGGLIVAAVLNNRFQERTRKLDLYKTIYPEKVKAATALMQQADALFQAASYAAVTGGRVTEQLEDKVRESSRNMSETISQNAWLMGSDVKGLAGDLVHAALMIYNTFDTEERNQMMQDWLTVEPKHGDGGKYQALYAELGQAVRQQLHLGTLDKLLPKE